MKKACVTGGGGFIGSHLIKYLKERGYWVRAVDIKKPQWSESLADEQWFNCDLRRHNNAVQAVAGCDEVYALAADMGGMGFISSHHYDILYNNALINLNTAAAIRTNRKVERLLYTSSACVYPERLQLTEKARSLLESDAWDGAPDTAYGVEKLFSEEVYTRLAEDAGTQVRIARFHNVFGAEGSWNDGREKLPAAACRKVAVAVLTGNSHVKVWGDGLATRSFCYINDCLEMLFRLMQSGYGEPMNIGTDQAVSVNEVFETVARVASVDIELVHIEGPQGVRGRNADLTKMREVLGYEPLVSLENGLARTYEWVYGQAGRLICETI